MKAGHESFSKKEPDAPLRTLSYTGKLRHEVLKESEDAACRAKSRLTVITVMSEFCSVLVVCGGQFRVTLPVFKDALLHDQSSKSLCLQSGYILFAMQRFPCILLKTIHSSHLPS